MARPLRWLPPLLFLLLVAVALWPALRAGPLLSTRYDWRYFEAMAEVARRTVVDHHQAPLWNPYSCGGEVDLANPQSLDGAPTFLLTLLFGTAWGFKLALVIYYLLALGGMYQLARRLGMAMAPSLVAAAGFGLAGYQAIHLAVGHINFASVALFPYLVYCFDRALGRWEWIFPTGALAAWVALYGGTFTPALAGELLLLWGGVALGSWPVDAPVLTVAQRLRRVVLLLAAGAAVALLLGAYRMLPALEFVFDHPRPLFRRTPDMTTVQRLFGDLFAWRPFGPLAGRRYWSHEYTARLPWALLPLLIVSLVGIGWPSPTTTAAGRRLGAGLALGGLCAALLSLGNFSPLAPWSLLQRLPVLRDLRVPSRHLVLVVFFAALLAGAGAQQIVGWLRRLRPGLATLLGLLLALAVAVDGAAYTAMQFREVFAVRLVIPSPLPPFGYTEGHWSQMRELIFAGQGVLHCDEEAPLQRAAALDAGPVAQARLFDPSAGQVVEVQRSPNRWSLVVELRRSDSLLLLNSNWNEHFRAAPAGAVAIKLGGRLAVDLQRLGTGRQRVEVFYAPRSFTVGVALSLLSWPLAIGLFVAQRRRRRGAAVRGWRSGTAPDSRCWPLG